MPKLNTFTVKFLLLFTLPFSASILACGGEKHDDASSKHASHQKHDQQAQEQIEISQATVRGLPPGQKNTAAFFTMKNVTDRTLELKKLSSPSAKKAEMHKTQEQAGQMQMRKLDSLSIKPGETIVFEPNGKHIMLMGLTKPLKEGDQVTLRLCFTEFCRMLDMPVVSVLNEKAHSHNHSHH